MPDVSQPVSVSAQVEQAVGGKDMETIAGFIARVLVDREDPETVGKDVMDFRLPKQTLYYNFDNEYPAWAQR